MRARRTLLTTLSIALASAAVLPAGAQDAPEGRYQGFGDTGGFWNIVPPGQDGTLNSLEAAQGAAGAGTPEHFDDQLAMYGDLVYDDATPGFAIDDLPEYFKDASFGVPPDDVERTYSPGDRDDVVVIRDASFGVPHIYGETREGTMFAQGYTAAEDRMFLMDALRRVGRAELSAWLGASEASLRQDASQMAAAPYTEQDLEEQAEAMRTGTAREQQAYADGQAYMDGVNQYIQEAYLDPRKMPSEYLALQVPLEEWKPTDVIAIASLVGGIFGKSGGNEVGNYCAMRELTDAYGNGQVAPQVFEDLTFRSDEEAPTTAWDAFSYPATAPADATSIPEIDCDSLRPIEAPDPSPQHAPGAVIDLVPDPAEPDGPEDLPLPNGASIPLSFNEELSNALLIGADHAAGGRPIAVFGPQTGYFAPQLLVEKDVHGPGISARGVAFAGTDIYVQLGRGADYAWSATSAHVDNVDEFVLELCDPEGGEVTVDSRGYRYGDECRLIEAHQEVLIAKPSAAGQPDSPEDLYINKYFERAPDYGPISRRGTLVDGTPIAIAEARSTYGAELASAAGFQAINDPDVMADGFAAFREAFQQVDYVFNWFYVDDSSIGYQVSCKCPLPADGTDPWMPQWGNGAWDWDGTLDREALPWDLDPDEGYLISWNNKEAPGFRHSDSTDSFGSTFRSDLLERRLRTEQAEGPVDVGEAVDIMALAATTDLRAQELMPLLEELLGETPPSGLDPRTADMWGHLRAWAADDLGHRRDHDRDGVYEHPEAVAIMDAWWGDAPGHPGSRLLDAMFTEGHPADLLDVVGVGISDGNLRGHVGSAFQGSAYAHAHKDLRQVLGHEVTDPWSRTYCGGGDLGVCRARLWTSLSETAEALEAEFGSAEVDDWDRVPADDEIRHVTLGVVGVPPIHWQNRPTFQQVVQVGGAVAPADPAGGEDAVNAALDAEETPMPDTGGGGSALGLTLLALAAAGAWTARRGW